MNKIFDNTLVEEKPSDVLLSFIENYCIEAADDFLPKIVAPYFCFYTGTVLVGKFKEAVNDNTGTKNELIADFCSAVESK